MHRAALAKDPGLWCKSPSLWTYHGSAVQEDALWSWQLGHTISSASIPQLEGLGGIPAREPALGKPGTALQGPHGGQRAA